MLVFYGAKYTLLNVIWWDPTTSNRYFQGREKAVFEIHSFPLHLYDTVHPRLVYVVLLVQKSPRSSLLVLQKPYIARIGILFGIY